MTLTDESEQTDNKLKDFFSGLADRMEIAASEERKTARSEAPRFNVFDYIEPDEVKLTAILADILNPNGNHGQGDVFLRSFINRTGFEGPSSDQIGRAVVRTEYTTRGNRRIDLTVTMGPHFIGLENKIGAREQPDQVGHYMSCLETEVNRSWFFIFLTLDGRDPDT